MASNDHIVRIGQVNVGKSEKSLTEVVAYATEHSLDYMLVQEPYCYKKGQKYVAGTYVGAKVYPEESEETIKCVVVEFSQISEMVPLPHASNNQVSWVTVTSEWRGSTSSQQTFALGSYYIAPEKRDDYEITALEASMEHIRGPCILGGDANAEHPLWCDREMNDEGEVFVEFIGTHNLAVMNSLDSEPTYQKDRAGSTVKGWIDVSMNRGLSTCGWTLDDHTPMIENHRYIRFDIVLNRGTEATRPYKSRAFACARADWEKFDVELAQRLVEWSDGPWDDANDKAALIQRLVTESAVKSIPRVKPPKRRRVAWWTPELSLLRKEKIALFKVHKRSKLPSTYERYKVARKAFDVARLKAKADSWKEFVSSIQGGDVFGGAYRVLAGKAKQLRSLRAVKGSDGIVRTNPQEIVECLCASYFPADSASVGASQESVEVSAWKATGGTRDDPDFTTDEVRRAFASLQPKKAPGEDCLTGEILRRAFKGNEEKFVGLFNLCLREGVFPDAWKLSLLRIIPKPGRTGSKISDFRPICLLPVLGKVLDRLIVSRVNYHLAARNFFSERQHGFVEGKSTASAVSSIVEWCEAKQAAGERVLLLSLDVDGAFNNAWWSWILHTLAKEETPSNLLNLCRSYFSERQVVYRSIAAYLKLKVDRGCPQGSVSGPAYWNILLNDLLSMELNDDETISAYADDLMLGVSGKSRKQLAERMTGLMGRTGGWLSGHKLSLNPAKCVLMPVDSLRLRVDVDGPSGSRMMVPFKDLSRLTVSYNGVVIRAVETMKYLGVTLDRRLGFGAHVENVVGKGQTVAAMFARVAKSSYGPRFAAMKRLHEAVVVPTVTYCSEVWGKRFERGEMKTWETKLNRAERVSLLGTTRAEKFVSNEALAVLAGVLPLKYVVKEKVRVAKRLTDDDVERPVQSLALGHPASWSSTSIITGAVVPPLPFQIFSDGSKVGDEGHVGSAFVVFHNGEEIASKRLKLPPHCTVFTAEVVGIAAALEWCEESGIGEAVLCSDSQAAVAAFANSASRIARVAAVRPVERRLRDRGVRVSLMWVKAHVGLEGNERADRLANEARTEGEPVVSSVPKCFIKRTHREESMVAWQREWGRSTHGRKVYEMYPFVRDAVSSKLQTDHYTTQVLTGHGEFNAYLFLRKLVESPKCPLCDADEDTVDHFLYECSGLEYCRLGVRDLLDSAKANGPGALIDGVEAMGRFRSFCHDAIRFKRACVRGPRSDQLTGVSRTRERQ